MTSPTVTPIRVGDLRVGVYVLGQGEPIILLHGWGGSSANFLPVISRLSQEGFACHVLDLPGFGMSDLPSQAWDVPRYAQFVKDYMDFADLPKASLIGHSFGGRISLVLGAECPERIKKLVLVNSAGVRLPPSLKTRFYTLGRRAIFAMLKLPLMKRFEPPLRRWFRQKFGSADYLSAGALAETFKQVVNQDLTGYAKRITAPTLLIWGDLDHETPIQAARILESAIPDAGLVIFEGAGHFSYLDRPLEFVRIVTRFLRT